MEKKITFEIPYKPNSKIAEQIQELILDRQPILYKPINPRYEIEIEFKDHKVVDYVRIINNGYELDFEEYVRLIKDIIDIIKNIENGDDIAQRIFNQIRYGYDN